MKSISGKDFAKILERNGWTKLRVQGSHHIYGKPGKALHRVRVDPMRLTSRFLLHRLFWASEQGHWADVKTQTTIAHLTGVKLKAYKVLGPPFAQQQVIAAYLDDLQAKVDSLKRLQAETAAELDALLPSVLVRAFKGNL